jgi:hypothetical protein
MFGFERGQWMKYAEYKRELLFAIEDRAKCSAVYYQTQPVKISMDGKTLWDGKVEIFQLKEHPQAKLAFGWGFKNDKDKMEYIVVIGVPPLDSPLQAVKAYVHSRKE